MPAAAKVAAVARSHIVPLHGPGLVLLGWIVGVLLLLIVVLWRIASVRRSLLEAVPPGRRWLLCWRSAAPIWGSPRRCRLGSRRTYTVPPCVASCGR